MCGTCNAGQALSESRMTENTQLAGKRGSQVLCQLMHLLQKYKKREPGAPPCCSSRIGEGVETLPLPFPAGRWRAKCLRPAGRPLKGTQSSAPCKASQGGGIAGFHSMPAQHPIKLTALPVCCPPVHGLSDVQHQTWSGSIGASAALPAFA